MWGARGRPQGGSETRTYRGWTVIPRSARTHRAGRGLGTANVHNARPQRHTLSSRSTSPYPEPPSSANSFRSLYMPYPMMNRAIDAM